MSASSAFNDEKGGSSSVGEPEYGHDPASGGIFSSDYKRYRATWCSLTRILFVVLLGGGVPVQLIAGEVQGVGGVLYVKMHFVLQYKTLSKWTLFAIRPVIYNRCFFSGGEALTVISSLASNDNPALVLTFNTCAFTGVCLQAFTCLEFVFTWCFVRWYLMKGLSDWVPGLRSAPPLLDSAQSGSTASRYTHAPYSKYKDIDLVYYDLE